MNEDNWEQHKKENCSEYDKFLEALHKHYPKEMEEARIWAREFVNSQESLDYEFNKLIEDNFWELVQE